MIGPFKPAPHIAELPADKIDARYRFLRWQVFAGIFFGYAAYYFVRANFDLAQKGLIEAGMYNKAELGIIGTGAGLAYGLSKFFMASISDRSNPKVFFTFRFALIWFVYDNDGSHAMGNVRDCRDVHHDFLKRLVPRYGLATMWSYNGALVV
ncbi:glycerol-3-phosphate transporter [Pasteurella multocida]|nr:glycerol-3-phosphate transporter [Pasteurella multocida]